MNRHLSDAGTILSLARMNVARKSGPVWQRLGGWTPAAEMPSTDDIQKTHGSLIDLCGGGEILFVSEVAASMPEYRGTCTFAHDGAPHFGIEFFYRGGSLFLAFRCDGEKTVRLFYSGMSQHRTSPERKILYRCSRFAITFGARLEEAYFDLRDEIAGKHGIPGAAH